jgi:hypothetical protein
MATKLEKTIKRELDLEGKTYTIAIGPDGLKITEKGHRRGQELSWRSLIGGGGHGGASAGAGSFDTVSPSSD